MYYSLILSYAIYFIIFICIVIFIKLYIIKNYKENFTNIQKDYAKSIFFYLKSNPSYIGYLNFLNNSKNTSLKLIDENIFEDLKNRALNNTLNINTILNYL